MHRISALRPLPCACRRAARRPIALILALLAASLGAAPGQAQEGQAAAPDECASQPNDAAEIECLRKALAASREALRAQDATPDPATPQASPRPPELAATPQPAIPDRQELGSEQVAARTPQPDDDPAADRLVSAITEFRRDRRGLLVMKLENGQIWRQVEEVGLPINIDEDERTSVEIARSGFGGYRMFFSETGRRLAVARIQ